MGIIHLNILSLTFSVLRLLLIVLHLSENDMVIKIFGLPKMFPLYPVLNIFTVGIQIKCYNKQT